MNPVHCFPVCFCVYYNCTQENEKHLRTKFFYSLPPHSFPILCFHISLSLLYGASNSYQSTRRFFVFFSPNKSLFPIRIYDNIYLYAPAYCPALFLYEQWLIGGFFFCQI